MREVAVCGRFADRLRQEIFRDQTEAQPSIPRWFMAVANLAQRTNVRVAPRSYRSLSAKLGPDAIPRVSEVARMPQRSTMFPICRQNSLLPNAQPNF
jgi:hypothetical protein